MIKVIHAIQELNHIEDDDYKSEKCLEYLKKIDNSFSQNKEFRHDIVKYMIESKFPGLSFENLMIILIINIYIL